MSKWRGISCLVFFMLIVAGASAQNEANKWYFGNLAGLDFNTSPPTAIASSAMNAPAGCASIANAAGNLLFYTDGSTVWDATNNVMANGSGLAGLNSADQSCIIIKKPGSPGIYYIFTTGTSSGLCYSTINMALAAGNGSVTNKNTVLLAGTSSQKLSATLHCNGTDVWIVGRDGYNVLATGINFYAYLVTSAGVGAVPVVSPAYNPWPSGSFTFSDYGGMKISPNGKKLGLAAYASINLGPSNYAFEVYDFNANTGAITNSVGLYPLTNSNNEFNYAHSCEFSPDGTKFYGSYPWSTAGFNPAALMQWDLCAGTATAVAASAYTVSYSIYRTQFGSLQLGPDGRVYVAKSGQNDLAYIGSPNLAGAACNLQLTGPSISGVPYFEMPNFMSSYLRKPQTIAPFTYTPTCLTATFTAPTPTIACAAAGYSTTGITWLFGDPASLAANTSTLQNPVHNYPATGTYTVKLIFHYPCGADTLTQPVSVLIASVNVTPSGISCAAKGTATAVAVGGIGPYSYTWMPGSQAAATATDLVPGTYSVIVRDIGASCTIIDTVHFTSLIAFTGTVVSSSSLACNSVNTATAGILLGGGSGSQSYTWTGGPGAQSTATATGLSASNYTITVVDAITACRLTQTFVITQPPSVSLSIAASSPTACTGNNITFTANTSGGVPAYSYTWLPGPTTNTNTVSEPTPGSYIYTVTSRDINNCDITKTVNVSFTQPTVSVANVSICPLQTGTLTASGASTYTWNAASTGSNFAASPAGTTEYTVVGSSINGCTSTAVTASIVVKPAPVASFTFNNIPCTGQPLYISASGGNTYTWSGPMGFAPNIQSPVIATLSAGSAGVYNLSVTAANNCTASVSSTLVVNTTPTVSATGNTVCAGQTLTLGAVSPAGSYSWSGPGAFSSTAQNPSISNATGTMSGNYSVVATSAQGCTNVASANAQVIGFPGATITPNYTNMCQGNTLVLNGSGGNTYSWFGPNNFNSLQQNPQLANVTALATGMYTLLVSTGPCSTTATQSITVHNLPTPTVSTAPACENGNLLLNGGGGSTYSWTGPNNYSSIAQSPIINPALLSNAGSYTLTVTDANNCQASALINATVLVSPTVTATGTTVCFGQPAVIKAVGASSFAWSGPGGFTANTASLVIIASNSAPQPYMVVGTAPNSCTSGATALLNTIPLPNISVTVTPRVCQNASISLQASGGDSAYVWQGPYHFAANRQNVLFIASNMNYNGTYTVSAMNNSGCVGSTTANVQVDPLPQADLASSVQNYCVPFCADFSLKLKSGSPLVSTAWEVNGKAYPDASFRYCLTSTDSPVIQSTFTDMTGCSNTATFVIPVHASPKANFEFTPEVPAEDIDEVQFNNSSSGPQLSSFSWYFIDNDGYTSSSRNTSYKFEKAGTYVVSMVARDVWGCSDTIVKTVVVRSDFNLYVPDAFTPNYDYVNDVFEPKGTGIGSYKLAIYNRWGDNLFESSDVAHGWDGTFKGQQCKSEVYIWKINATDQQGNPRTMTGSVMLYR